jgi:membrane protein required for colicin V production
MTTMNDIGWVDWALLAVLLASVIVGLVRGLVFEVLSLLGWVAAYVAAQMMSPELAPHVPVGAPGSALNHGAAFAVVFVLALIVWMLMARLIRLIVHATPLTLIDRTLGGVFGLARGAVAPGHRGVIHASRASRAVAASHAPWLACCCRA